MEVSDSLAQLGGLATTAELRKRHRKVDIEAAVAGGRVIRTARGHYALRSTDEARRAAARLRGTVSHLSAARLHRWPIARDPDLPWVTVPRNRKPRGADVHLVFGNVVGPVTPKRTTVLDCARRLPWPEALTVADSALRVGDVDSDELRAAAARARGPGATQVRRVAREARSEAANPMESVLRAIALDVRGLAVRPQVEVDLGRFRVHPDLADEHLGIVIEAEGRLHQTMRTKFLSDVERYTMLATRGWLVLRFTFSEVMGRPSYVTDCLEAAVLLRRRHLGCIPAGRAMVS